MMKFKRKLILAALAVSCFLCTSNVVAQATRQSVPSRTTQTQPGDSTSNPIAADQSQKPITAYTLPPDLYQKTKRLERIRILFLVVSSVYGLVLLWFFLRWKLGPKYRNWAERPSTNLFFQVLVFAPLLLLTLDFLALPLDIFEHWESRNYGLSIQHWGSWAWDWCKGELVMVVLAIIVITILYWIVRKSPRRWWFYFWLVSLPLILMQIFIQPLLVDPLFHKFEPLQQKDPALTAALEQMVHRAGQDIPPDRIYSMNASEKVNELNAYVTGIGSSKRIVFWDTTLAKMTTPEVVAVGSHEMGHYVLNHIPKGFSIYAIGLFFVFYLSYRCLGWAIQRWGPAWQIQSVQDFASLPVLLLLLSIVAFILTPVTNGISRYFEHQADQYALEVTHGLTPDSGQVAAKAFQVLGEVDLDYPDPSRFDVLMTYDHPATRDRVRFALTYAPWANGGTGEFVH
jgi:STE24 endopeptidase